MLRLITVVLLLPAAAVAADTWSIASNGSATNNLDYVKANVVHVTTTTTVEELSVYLRPTASQTMTFGIWVNNTGSSWSSIWAGSISVSSTGTAGFYTVYPGFEIQAGESYAFGVHFPSSTDYYYSSSPTGTNPVFGTRGGYISYATTVYPTGMSQAPSSTGAYRMEIVTDDASDDDFDGWTTPADCDDDDPLVNPAAFETCDGVDTDCDGFLGADEEDDDFDGYLACIDDCDDLDAGIWPGAPERCNGVDDDCDLSADEGLTWDEDGDGYSSTASCGGTADDCADLEPAVHPGATEACNHVDDDCDFSVDEGFTYDADNDFFDNEACGGGDCDDLDPLTFPGAVEQCDGEDNDCDGASAADETVDADGDGATTCTDCDDADADVYPGRAEDCTNGVDDNCNGAVDEATDSDGDGFGACDDCDDDDPAVYPGADEQACNGLDDDCDGALADGESDGDGDGVRGCEGDCDDANAAVLPGADEVCDGVDNDCDGALHPDEGAENDADGDGVPVCFDCDDEDPDVYPGAEEDECVDEDADCDGVAPDVDEDDCDQGGGGRRRRGCDLSGASGLGLLLLLGRRRR